MKLLGMLAMVVGLVLMVLSFFWTSAFPSEDRWTTEQAQAHRLAAAKYHDLQHSAGHMHAPKARGSTTTNKPNVTQADVDAAKKEWEEIETSRRTAQESGTKTAWWLRFAGAAVAALGVAAIFAAKKRGPNRPHQPDSH